MADHFIKETRFYQDGRVRVTYWCGKREIVPHNEELDIGKGLARRKPSDCRKCVNASGWR